jgi:hypothetical protein
MNISDLASMGYYHANVVPPEATTGWQSGGVPAPQQENWQTGGMPAGQPDQYSEMTPEEMMMAQRLEQLEQNLLLQQEYIAQLEGALPADETAEAAPEEPAATAADEQAAVDEPADTTEEPPAATGTDPNPYGEYAGLERKSNPLKAGFIGLASSAIAATIGAVLPGNHDNKLIYQGLVGATASGAAGYVEYATGGDANSVALAMGVGGAGGFAGSHKLASVKHDVNFTNGVIDVTPPSLVGKTDAITINNIETATNDLKSKNDRIAQLTAQGLSPETAEQLATVPLPKDWLTQAMRLFEKLDGNYSVANVDQRLSSPKSIRDTLDAIEAPWRNFMVAFNREARFTKPQKDFVRALEAAIKNTKRPAPPPAAAATTTAAAAATP